MGDETARLDGHRILAELRRAERGHYDPDRGHYDPDRGHYDPDRGHYDPDRGHYDPDRGHYDPDRGGALDNSMAEAYATRAVEDVIRRAAGIGGHLIVAFVAPVGASSASRRRPASRAASLDVEAAAARTQVAALTELLRQSRGRNGQPKPASPGGGSAVHSPHAATYESTQQPAEMRASPATPSRKTGA